MRFKYIIMIIIFCICMISSCTNNDSNIPSKKLPTGQVLSDEAKNIKTIDNSNAKRYEECVSKLYKENSRNIMTVDNIINNTCGEYKYNPHREALLMKCIKETDNIINRDDSGFPMSKRYDIYNERCGHLK